MNQISTLLAAVLLCAASLSATGLLDARLDLELKDAPYEDVLESFGQILQAEVVIEKDISGEVTIQLNRVRLRTVLDAVCDGIGCRWRLDEGEPRRLYFWADDRSGTIRVPGFEPEGTAAERLDEPITMSLAGAAALDVFASFAGILGAELEVEGEFAAVTIELEDKPAAEAMDTVCGLLGCKWELVEDGEKPTLRFSAEDGA